MSVVQNYSLNNHAVRIRQHEDTIGTGFLVVPEEGYFAYVLTAAHVLYDVHQVLNLQFFGDFKHDADARNVSWENYIFHSSYHHDRNRQEVQYGDAALIQIQKEDWMLSLPPVFWGIPLSGIPIEAIAFSYANSDCDIRHGSAFLRTSIRVYTPDTHRISATIAGEIRLNDADRNYEIEGMSGSVFAAQGQDSIILVGLFCSTTGDNAVHGQMNMVDMTALCELLSQQGVFLSQRVINSIVTENAPTEMATEALVADRHFVCRDRELTQIQQIIVASKLVVLSGIGGVGKTGLALQYAESHRDEYRVICQVSCLDGIALGFARQVNIPDMERKVNSGIPESDQSFGRRKLAWLHNQNRRYLLILDDVDPTDSDCRNLLSLPVDKIITSRWNRSAWTCSVLDVNVLPTLSDRLKLFEAYYEQELDEIQYDDFEAIDTLVEGHTLTLQLIALQSVNADLSLTCIRRVLEEQGVYTDNPNIFSYGNSVKECNMYGHIRAIWNLTVLEGKQKLIMQGISLLSPQKILRSEFRDWLGLENANDINRLLQKGWIEQHRQQGSTFIRAHMVIADVICQELCQTYPQELSPMFDLIYMKMINRDLDFEERMRFIHYGEQLARRLPVCKEVIKFIQDLSMEEESIRQFETAQKLLERSERYLERIQLQSDILQADNDSDMGIVLQGQRKYKDAQIYLRRARKAYEDLREIYPTRYSVHLYNEARLLQQMERYEDAIKLARQAENMCIEHAPRYLGKVYDVIANHHAYLARKEVVLINASKSQEVACRHLSKYKRYVQKECEYWCHATAAKEQFNCDEQYDIMVSKSNLACTQALLGNRDAHTTIQSVLQYYVRTTGERSSYVAHTYDQMCMIYENLGNLNKSIECGQQSAAIYIELYGSDTIELNSVYHNLIISFKGMGDSTAVEYYTREYRRIIALY